MSRIGRMPIAMPKEVKVTSVPPKVEVTGPKGLLAYSLPQGISVSVEGEKILVHRANDQRTTRALQGLTRSLIANMVAGVTRGFEKKLEIVGVGFRVDLQGSTLKLTLGYSHPVLYPIPKGIQVEVDKQTLLTVKGSNRQQVGSVAAQLRSIKPPEPYKGKGVRYLGERIRKKVGKTKA
jgi:large subunit ribosomal protein L6